MAKRPISFLAFFQIWADYKRWEVPDLHIRICLWLEWFFTHARVGVLEVFRGASKSTITAVFQAWIIHQDHQFRLLDQGADDAVAIKLAKDTRQVLRRHPLCKGMLAKRDPAVSSVNVIGNDDARNPNVSAHGALSNVTSSRADGVVFDDVEVPKNIRTAPAREGLRERMGEATQILTPGGWKLYIGTPHTFDSIYDEQVSGGAALLKIPLFERQVRYEETSRQTKYPFNFAAKPDDLYVFLGIGKRAKLLQLWKDYLVQGRIVILNEPPGVLLDIYSECAWPERFNRADLEFRRQESRTINTWDAQYMLEAKPIHQVRLDPVKIHAYDLEPRIAVANDTVRMMLGQVQLVGASAYWDCALGKLNSDDSALSVVFTDAKGTLYWHIAAAMTGDIYSQCRQVREIVQRLMLTSMIVETNGVGGFVPAILRQQLVGTGCGVIDFPTSGNKDERILDALEAPISGRFLWAHSKALDAFEGQMRDWIPGVKGQPDDYLDSSAGAIAATPVRIGKLPAGYQTGGGIDWRPDSGEFDIKIGG